MIVTMMPNRAKMKRSLTVWAIRRRWMPFIEVGTGLSLLIAGALSYLILTRGMPGQRLLTPPLVALLLVANLVPAIALLVLIGRRVAKGRAARSPIGGGGRLHVRLVGIFSLVAAVPMLLVVIFASLLFQYGVEFWFSDRARGMLQNASGLAQGYYQEKRNAVASETVTMAGDLRDYLAQASTDSPAFAEGYAWQVLSRNLTESAIVEVAGSNGPRTIAMVNPDARPVEKRISPGVMARLNAGEPFVVTDSSDRIEAVTRLYPGRNIYLYASRIADRHALLQTRRAKAVLADYDGLLDRSRKLQLQFNAALFLVSLFIVGAAVWIALNVADRLVRPVGELVHAARRVAAGDLSARVASPRTQDEVGTLALAFNRMTRRLEEQTDALNSRRALIEAVLSGVTAGVVSINSERVVRLLNARAETLLGVVGQRVIGETLIDVAPELAELLDSGATGGVIQTGESPNIRTLAVKIVSDEQGFVLTFDDITQQLLDQRRAAWADVARRIAHEIKNPLTPIQLAAERLKRRFGGEVKSDPGTFVQLTDTIIRQVGDLRRMVDEFSSFARMPRPVFRHESLTEIAHQTLFLHEVAHPGIAFELDAPGDGAPLVCDRRQLGQALTNLVKNAVEAIAQQEGGEAAGGEVTVTIRFSDGAYCVQIADTGVGLPADRDHLVEPYVTTRTRGTGLGLAIVNKIIEEHAGTMTFGDRPGGGALITLRLDPAVLAPLVEERNGEDQSSDVFHKAII